MSSKRMSKDEKRQVVLGIYHKTKSVFTEKEIHTLAAKAGVNANTVPDINNSLVDDGLVDKEKIGGSNYFWSFPAKQDRQNQIKHQETLELIEKLRQEITQKEFQLHEAKRGREDSTTTTTGSEEQESRSDKLLRLSQLRQKRQEMTMELEKLQENDPAKLEDLEKELKLVTEAAHRWTDNIFNCQSYLVKKRGMDKKEANKILQITSAFDYPEDKIPK